MSAEALTDWELSDLEFQELLESLDSYDGEDGDGEVVEFPRGNQPAQDVYMRDLLPGWCLYQGGLGSGKTYASARKLCYLHALNECPSLAVAPTYGDLWRFVVPAIVDALKAWHWPYDINRATLPQIVTCGQPIYLISAEHPDRFAGFEVGALWVDEGARIQCSMNDPLRDAPTQIRTRLRHPKAKILHGMVSTTPEGTDTWIQKAWFDQPLPNHRSYIGNTLANPALPASYVESLKASLPAELVEQYISGKAVSYVANRAHPTFSKARNVREFPWMPNLPLHVGCDYNVSPMFWIAAQHVGEELRIIDEVYLPDFAQVDGAMHAAKARGWGDYFIHFHPDKSAKARSTVGDPEYTVMSNKAREFGWRYTGDAYGVNPPIDARINLVSRLVLNATGVSRLVVHPRCTYIIEDFERTARATNGYDPGELGMRGHGLDALGYVAWDIMAPMGKAGTSDLLN